MKLPMITKLVAAALLVPGLAWAQSQGISKLSRSVESISMKFLNLCQLGLLGDYRLYGLAVLAFHTRFPNLQS